MATKIIQRTPVWNPVSINMTFETPEQLRVFVEIMGSEGAVASVVAQELETPEAEAVIEITNIIRGLIDYDTWRELRQMVR